MELHFKVANNQLHNYVILEDTARYAGLLLSLGRGFFLGQKKAFYAFLPNFKPFLVFSSNLSNFY